MYVHMYIINYMRQFMAYNERFFLTLVKIDYTKKYQRCK